MSRIVLNPTDLGQRLNQLANLAPETNGVLIYKPRRDICPVSTLLMTGKGTEGHVVSDPKRRELINMMLSQDPELRFIKFHTHTSETARRFGKQYLRQFSQGDLDAYREQFKHDKEFIGMLVTPTTQLLCGLDNPQLHSVSPDPEILAERTRVEGMFQRVLAESGIEIDNFMARRA